MSISGIGNLLLIESLISKLRYCLHSQCQSQAWIKEEGDANHDVILFWTSACE